LANSEESLKENIHLIVIIFQLYPDSNEEIECFLAKSLNRIFKIPTTFMTESEYDKNFRILFIRHIILFVDIFFHNPYFVQLLDDSEKDFFVNNLVKLTKILYDPLKELDIQISLQYSVSVLFYFPENIIEKYKPFYENHFDKSVISDFKELNN